MATVAALGNRVDIKKLDDSFRKVNVWAGWGGIIFTAGFLLACIPGVSYQIPPTLNAMNTPQEVHDFYVAHTLGIQIGAWLGMCFSAFYYVWGAAVAAMLRRVENGRPPVLTYIQLGAIGVGVFNSVLYFFWMAWCAFRCADIPPEMLRSMNDMLFIQLEFEVFPLSLWAVAIGLEILLDKSPNPVFPRWCGWLNFWYAGLVMTGQFMIFFHAGPFAWNGVFALYWPAFVFFAWISAMSWMMLKPIKTDSGVQHVSQELYT
ncbi:MAG TPA: hypothetical protein VM578_04495 [Candidatus Saccharimonadales bacterium]|nr:hypothetical protein [Candidatus Saccharimonadales bacterium]